METKYKKALSLLILGSRGVGKSRLGNKLLGKKEFIEDSLTTETTKFSNKSGIEIIDTKGLGDSDGENKILISSICNEIKKNKPNILAFVHNTPNKILNESSKTLIQEICKMFDTKSVWDHFIIIFTFASNINEENREKYGSDFSNSILKVITDYYESNNINCNLPVPKKLKYYFMELGDNDEYKLDKDTINNLDDIIKSVSLAPPVSNTSEKVIIEIKTKKCKETLRIYDKYKDNAFQKVKEKIEIAGINYIYPYLTNNSVKSVLLSSVGFAFFPVITPLIIGGSYLASNYLGTKKIDDKFQNEDFIIFDEETYIYHDGSTEIKRINIEKFTRTIPK